MEPKHPETYSEYQNHHTGLSPSIFFADLNMAGKKTSGENSKKASGNAKKAEAAAQKAALDNSKKAAEEDQEWSKGAKSSAKK